MINAPPIAPHISGYHFIRVLGNGSTAMVLLYERQTPTCLVAVKVSTLADRSSAASLIRHEALMMERLPDHPHILPCLGTGTDGDGRGYLIIGYAPGGTIAARLRHGTIPCEHTLAYGVQLAGALHTAHRCAVIHHDIKPSNILLEANGHAMLGDFGVSTDLYRIKGLGCSPPWAAPEVLSGRSPGTEVSDVYSLAASLFAMMTGTSPYELWYRPANEDELIATIINRPLPRPGELTPTPAHDPAGPQSPTSSDDSGTLRASRFRRSPHRGGAPHDSGIPHASTIPRDVALVLHTALAKNPSQRFFSALQFARALQHVQYERFGYATALRVDGVPQYPHDLAPRHPLAAANADSSRTDATTPSDIGQSPHDRRHRGRKSLRIAIITLPTILTLCLASAWLVMPNMDIWEAPTRIEIPL